GEPHRTDTDQRGDPDRRDEPQGLEFRLHALALPAGNYTPVRGQATNSFVGRTPSSGPVRTGLSAGGGGIRTLGPRQ
ncbi:MAG TPA: hypothetical protein VNN75_00220, partial [Stellaceae bacterium]|nr:hypothetical protein [Stellaceae bacterium]